MREKSKLNNGAKGRLMEYLEYKHIKKSEFYRATDLSNGFLDKNSNIGSDTIDLIISKFEDLDVGWLITGKGNMLRGESIESADRVFDSTIMKFLERMTSAFEHMNEGQTAIIKQNSELVNTHAEIVKQNSELIRQQSEALKVIQKLSDKLL